MSDKSEFLGSSVQNGLFRILAFGDRVGKPPSGRDLSTLFRFCPYEEK